MKAPESQVDMFASHLQKELNKQKEHRAASKKRYRESKKEQDPILFWAYNRIAKIKSKCKKHNIPFTLTVEWLIANMVTHCPLLGIELTFGEVNYINSASIDRKNPLLGYTPQNCFVISNKANRMKSDATLSELIILTENLKKYL